MLYQVGDLISRQLLSIHPEATLQEAIHLLGQTDVLPVCLDRRVKGIVNKDSLVKYLWLHKSHSPDAVVEDVLSTSFATIKATADVREIWDLPYEAIIVVDNQGQPLAATTKAEIARTLILGNIPGSDRAEHIFSGRHGVVMVDQDTSVVVFNQTAETLLNIKQEKIVGTPCLQYLTISGLPRVLRTGLNEYHDHMKVRKDKVVLVNRAPLMADGSIVGSLAIFTDISNQNATLVPLSDEIDAYPEAAFVAKVEGKLLKINTSFARLTDSRPEEVIGRNITELWNGEYKSLAIFMELAKSNTSLASEIITTASGRKMLAVGTPLKPDKVVINIYPFTNGYGKPTARGFFIPATDSNGKTLSGNSPNIVAASPQMRRVINLALKVSTVDTTVLLTGESGVGKELIADLIHNYSSRHHRPYITVNCGAIPDDLLESELFGYESGAFTGANCRGKPGRFQLADGGTIFLDEIGELPLKLQVKLLRVLQDKEITPLGGTKAKKVDVRVLSATNRDLHEMVRQGTFREDLYYRLAVVPINIPPLRERRDDILPIVEYLLKQLGARYNRSRTISQQVIDYFMAYSWPGNVRELENALEYAFVTNDNEEITLAALPEHLSRQKPETSPLLSYELPENPILKAASSQAEEQVIRDALQKYGSISRAALVLGVHPSTLSRKIKKMGLKWMRK